MKQYLEGLKQVLNYGTYKGPAREGMIGSTSLFGNMMKFDLQEGFPIVTTKEINFHKIATELVWFLRGDTNVAYLNENGFTEWNEDSYAYYLMRAKKDNMIPYNWEQYKDIWAYLRNSETPSDYNLLKEEDWKKLNIKRQVLPVNYKFGDCGYQYGKVWRDWDGVEQTTNKHGNGYFMRRNIDQLKKVFNSLKNQPLGRRHLVTAVDPVHDNNLALYWCHSMFQFNCRPLTYNDMLTYIERNHPEVINIRRASEIDVIKVIKKLNVPMYFLDCNMYQRSADMFLGVPFNISSYALLTMLFARMLNMVPGIYTHMFGDMHIYENHLDQVNLQLTREPHVLPRLYMSKRLDTMIKHEPMSFDFVINNLRPDDFKLDLYQSHNFIKGELSTGIPKEPKRKDFETDKDFNIAYNTYHGIAAGSGS